MSEHLTKFNVPPLIYFSVHDYEKYRDETIKKTQAFFADQVVTVAVRSSSLAEILQTAAMQQVESILNVIATKASCQCFEKSWKRSG